MIWYGSVWRYDKDQEDIPEDQRTRLMYECKHHEGHPTMDQALTCAQAWLDDLVAKGIDIECLALIAHPGGA